MPNSPCDWTAEVCEDCCTQAFASLSAETVETMKAWAVDFLWRATGQRFGLCAKTYRPCKRECVGSLSGFDPFVPYKYGSSWVNLSCNSCPGSCGCGGVISEIYLPGTYAVTGLVIDGESLDPAENVMVYDYSRIIRVGDSWPSCQDLSSPSASGTGEVGTWEITVLQGLPVPAGGGLAAGILACEFAKACSNDASCRLPKRVQTISRNGVTVGFQDMFEGLADLRTGIWEVDAFIEATRAVRWQSPVIGSPDLPDFPSQTFPVPT